jgi:RNase H-like domain found in reverse transcriptase
LLFATLNLHFSNNLIGSSEKSEFFRTENIFLGNRITKNGIFPLEKYVENLKDFKSPKSVKNLQSILESLNFIQKFIPQYAERTGIFYDLLKKDHKKFNWNPTMDSFLRSLIGSIDPESHLSHFDSEHQIVFYTDASDLAIAGHLNQFVDDKCLTDNYYLNPEDGHVVIFFLKKLTDSQINHTTIEKELLAIIVSIKKFKHLILRSKKNY